MATPLGAGVVVYLSVPDVNASFAQAREPGAVVGRAPHDESYGRNATINDPDGYAIVLIAGPPRETPRRAAWTSAGP